MIFLFGIILSNDQVLDFKKKVYNENKPKFTFEIDTQKISDNKKETLHFHVYDTLGLSLKIDKSNIKSVDLYKNNITGGWNHVLNANTEFVELDIILNQQLLMEFRLKADLQLLDGTTKTVYSSTFLVNDIVYPQITSFYNPHSVVSENDTIIIPIIIFDNIGIKSLKIVLIKDDDEIELYDLNFLTHEKIIRDQIKIIIPRTQYSDYMLLAVAEDIHGNSTKKLISALKINDSTLPKIEFVNFDYKDLYNNLDKLKLEWKSIDNREGLTDKLFILSENYNKEISELAGNKKNEFIIDLYDIICDSCRIFISSTDKIGLTHNFYSKYFIVIDTIPPEIKFKNLKIPNFIGINENINFHINLEDNIKLKKFNINLLNRHKLISSFYDTLFIEKNRVEFDIHFNTPELVMDSCQLEIIAEDFSYNKTNFRTDYFEITDNVPPQINIETPIKRESLGAGENFDIIWRVYDISGIDYQKLYYQLGQEDWEVITFLYNESTRYKWVVPNIVIDSARIKIEVVDFWGNSSSSTSDFFRILDKDLPEIEIIEPNKLSTYFDTDSMKIKLSLIDNIGLRNVQVLFASQNNKFIEQYKQSFSEPTIGELNFLLPPVKQILDSAFIKVNFQDFYYNNGTVISDPISILDGSPPVLKLIEPIFNFGKQDTFLQGDPIYIDWDVFENDSISSYKIFFLDYNGEWKKTSFNKPVSFYKWYISLYAEGNCKLKIEAENKSGLKSSIISDQFFVKNINTIFKNNYRSNDSGWVEIITKPESVSVTFNQDSTIGSTPLKFRTRAGFGRRLFEFEKEGYFPEKTRKRIYKDSTVTIDISLKPQTGTVNFYSNFDSTEVYVGEEYIGIAPIEDKGIIIGNHDVIFRSGEFYSDTINQNVEFNKIYTLEMEFDTLWGNINIITDPTSVEIFLDNKYMGKTDLSSFNIKTNVGTHFITYKIPEINVKIKDTIFVEPRRDAYLEVALLTKSFNNSYLSIDGWPTKSTVIIDNEILKTPLKYYPLKPGKNSIKVSQMGFISQEFEFTLEPRQHLKLPNYKLNLFDREKAISLTKIKDKNKWFSGYPGLGHLYVENQKWAGIWFGFQSTGLGITFHSYLLFITNFASYLKTYHSLSNSSPRNVLEKRIMFDNAKTSFGKTIFYSLAAHTLAGTIYKLCQMHIEENIPSPFIEVPLGDEKVDQKENKTIQPANN